MAGRFTKIPQDTFQQMQLDAGVLVKSFDPTKPEAFKAADIISATTGGVTANCQPTYSDQGEDVDNCPTNTKELKHLDSWDCSLATTCLSTTPESIRLSLGAADVDAASGKITPRATLKQTDFEDDIWWIGDKANGGLVAVDLKNALSTDGFSLQTNKNGSGQVSLTLTGHVSIDDQDTVPMVFYSTDPADSTTSSGTSG